MPQLNLLYFNLTLSFAHIIYRHAGDCHAYWWITHLEKYQKCQEQSLESWICKSLILQSNNNIIKRKFISVYASPLSTKSS